MDPLDRALDPSDLARRVIDQGEGTDWEQFWAHELTAWPDHAREQVRAALVMQALDLDHLPDLPPALQGALLEIDCDGLEPLDHPNQEPWD